MFAKGTQPFLPTNPWLVRRNRNGWLHAISAGRGKSDVSVLKFASLTTTSSNQLHLVSGNGETPCNVCRVRGEQCNNTPPSRKRKRRDAGDEVHDRLDRLEVLVRESNVSVAASNKTQAITLTQNNAVAIDGVDVTMLREQSILLVDEVRDCRSCKCSWCRLMRNK